MVFLSKGILVKKEGIDALVFPRVNLEEKQQSTLTEWYAAQENPFKAESQRQRSVPPVTEEYELLDDGGDAVFSQLVRHGELPADPRSRLEFKEH